MSYFNSTMTADEAKSMFRKMAVKLHPDKEGGSHLEFIRLKKEYENYLKGSHCFTSKQASDETNAMDEFIKANEFIKSFAGCTIELTGSWIWICGNTFPYKDQIKENGFSFSGAKKKWYKAPNELDKTKRKRGTSFEKIKTSYGYESFTIKDTTMKLK